MKTIAFFSYKGGVGRTLAAANFAVYLAKLGLKVGILDFDLDAPGIDSKFPGFVLPEGQYGLLDYILKFQREGSAPGPISDIVCNVPIASPRRECSLFLIPAGDYLSPFYPAKLSELNWSKIFLDELDGVAFFQLLLDRVRKDLAPDVLIIDSRTGFSEIGGLCTQQLADETVILSSLAAESIKMTRHLSGIIRDSEIATRLNKSVETKVVVTRVPKPQDISELKARCCEAFGVKETHLFFLFSCPGLEKEEFVAMLETQRSEELVANYIQLFQGLDVEVAQESIRDEIEKTERGLLSCTAAQAEARIREMVALFPHSEVYRRAMYFFDLRRKPEEAARYAIRLLDLEPDDVEAHTRVARFFLQRDSSIVSRSSRRNPEIADLHRLAVIAKRAYSMGTLSIEEKVRLADVLEDMDDFESSFEIAKHSLDSDELEGEQRQVAMAIAARTAIRLNKNEVAAQIVADIPVNKLTGSLASISVQLKSAAGDKSEAFEIAKSVLTKTFTTSMLHLAAPLADELGRREELVDIIRKNPEFERQRRRDPEVIWALERYGLQIDESKGRTTRSS